MNSKKIIVLVSTGQPSTNPRLVKEANSFHAAGFDVTVLYCYVIAWAYEQDKNLLSKVGWKYQMVGGDPFFKRKLFIKTKIRYKLALVLNALLGNKWTSAENAQARAYKELYKAAKNIQADWYIGHNVGALPVVVKVAKLFKVNCGFDFEDYYRGQMEISQKSDIRRNNFIEEKYVHQLNYISASSPMIAERVKLDFFNQKQKIFVLLNCFPLNQQPSFRKKSIQDTSLQLFWFSQTVGLNRGLEMIVEVMIQLNDPDIHLTLAGRCDEEFKTYLERKENRIKNQIHFAGIIPPDELPSFAAKFDVGLALETGFSENNKMALSNKIFTYLLAGNALIISETPMQKQFNKQFYLGESYKINNKLKFTECLKTYKNAVILEKQRFSNYNLANETLNWENESQKMLDAIKDY